MKKIYKDVISYVVVTTIMVSMMPTVGFAANESEVLTSDQIGVYGYQIKDGYADEEKTIPNIGFRTIAYAPAIGETITAGDKEYTIERTGIIYVLDFDCSGREENAMIDDTYTILAPTTRTGSGSEEYFEGNKAFTYSVNGQLQDLKLTYGYLSTQEHGYVSNYSSLYSQDESKTYMGVGYVRTMTNMGAFMANTIHVRTFVLATDGTIIYSSTTEHVSVAQIAYKMYKRAALGEKGGMTTQEGHEYLYDKILHSDYLKDLYDQDNTYPYYWTGNKVEFGWSPIVKPFS